MPLSKIISASSVTKNANIDKGLYFNGSGTTPIETGINRSISYAFNMDEARCTIERGIFHCRVLNVYTEPVPQEGTYLKYFEREFSIDGDISWATTGSIYQKEYTTFPTLVTLRENMSWTNTPWAGGKVDLHCYIQFDTIANTYLELFPGKPIASPLRPSGTAINPAVINRLTWELGYTEGYTESQNSAVVEWKKGENGNVNTINYASPNKYYDVPANTFGNGETICWRVKATSIYEKESDFSDWITFTTYIAPIIYSLEPDGINLNREKNIIASWSAVNYGSFVLDAIQNNTVISSYTGQTQAQLNIPASTIPSGTTTLRLKLTYNAEGYITTSGKEVEFLAYGAPEKPKQDNTEIYNTATPTFTWTAKQNPSDTPVSWEFKLTKDGTVVEETGEVAGSASRYTVKNVLKNHSSYVASIRVKNQFSLWSAWAEKTISTEFTELSKPTFEIITSGNTVVLDIVNTNHVMFKNSEVWRREEGSDWVRIAYNLGRVTTYTDHTLKNQTEYGYKVRSNAYDGAVSESDVKVISVLLAGFEFVNVENFANVWALKGTYGEKNISVDITNQRNVDATVYQGNIGATIETDGLSYQTISFDFKLSYTDFNRFIRLVNDSKVMLYRDERGHKCYGYVTSDITEKHIDFNGYQISFIFTQVSFLEKDMYSGDGGMEIVYLDGSYRLDGSLLLTGERVI